MEIVEYSKNPFANTLRPFFQIIIKYFFGEWQ